MAEGDGGVETPASTLMAFRLPRGMADAVITLAGRDREGRSGVIREALTEYLSKHGYESSYRPTEADLAYREAA